jgi:amino acid adenylation domain-containing protein/non-ribosomal peptide synthase protein (TIGR01720 family)
MSVADRLADRLASLTPEQRALFEALRQKQQKAARVLRVPPIPRVSGPTAEGDWPLSFDQERYWFMEQLFPDGAGLNITAVTRMRGPLVPARVEVALLEIVKRHAAWRTVFPTVDGRPTQRVVAARPVALPVIDLGGLPADRRECEALRLVEEGTAAPFDLELGPLVRARLMRLGDGEHLCLLAVHHLVTDWISSQIVWGELTAIYDALARGESLALPEPPVQYPDFAVWQRAWLQGEVLEELTSWWRERLAGFPVDLDLPTDRPRPPQLRMHGGRLPFTAGGELADGLRSLARQEGATLFMLVLALTATLLHRDSGQERLILGANNANRNRPEIETVLGCFLTQVPFPIDLGGDPPFRELLARVRQSALGSYAHQDLPFGQLVQAIGLARDPSRQPLIQTLVQTLDGQYSTAASASFTSEAVDAWDGRARYDLMLTIFDYPDHLQGGLEYDADLFDAATAARRLERFLRLATAAVADPDRRLSTLPVLSAAERHQVAVEWNDPAPVLSGVTIHGLFAEQAARVPAAVAVVCGDEEVTYGELARRARRVAGRLLAMGLAAESRVAVTAERSTRLIAALLGILQAGCAYLPLDPELPEERRRFLLADAGAVLLDLDGEGGRDEAPVLPKVAASQLAYVMYTSGSTGAPKGVAVTHGNVVRLVRGARWADLGPAETFLQLGNLAFDAATLEIWAPLLNGGRLALFPGRRPGLDELTDAIARYGVTSLWLTAGLFHQMVAERLEGLRPLRQLLAGGDVLSPARVRRALEGLPGCTVVNGYGPTENTTFTACFPMRGGGGGGWDATVPLGRPIQGTSVHVVDADLRPVPVGVWGELLAGGEGVARGYLGRPALTAERFVPDPFAGAPGGRLYRTGDLVRWRPDGLLEFLGRTDLQIKVRGFRIEPGEVEAALLAHRQVRDAVVVARPGAGGESRLVAYVVGSAGEDLRAFLRSRLPEAMIPSLFVPLAALPLNANGKVDRKALPAAQPAASEAAGAARPRTPKEERLAGIWRELLGLAEVGIHDNFFQLGGDSILSIQIVARARREGLLLTPRQIFESQTIAELAAVAAGDGSPENPGEDQGPVVGEAPLTPIQCRFFAEARREPWRFNQAVLLVPRERLAAAPLAAALDRLAAHHDALRLRFVPAGDEWRQVHAPVAPAPLVEVDLTAVPASALEVAVEQLQSGLDLAQGPLFTAALFRWGGGDRLLLTAHHLVVDGVSWRVLLEDLAAAYRGLDLPAKTTSWKSWTERLAAFSRSPEIAAELDYWLDDRLALPVSVPPLPCDLAGGGAPTTRASVAVELGAAETRALLQEVPEVYRTQVNDLLLAALVRAFAAWTGEGTLLVDLEGHGREEIFPDVDLSRTAGWFTTVFPVALTLPPGGGAREAIRGVKESLRAVPRRGLGYGLLRYLPDRGAGPESADRLAALPAPQVSFNYLGRLDAAAGEGGFFTLAPEPVHGAAGEIVAGAPLFAIDALVLDGRLRVSWTYDPGRYLPATVERLASGFVAEIVALVEHCLSPAAGGFTPSDFPLARLDQGALDRLLGAGHENNRGIEDLYPLAPMQEGMLFHGLYTGEGADLYFEQFTAVLAGPLDEAAFAAAWQRAVERHAALRTGFLWHGVERPLQLVRRAVEVPWTSVDWRDLAPADVETRWRDLLAADRARGFDLSRPPLLRIALARTGEQERRLVWSTHHILIDGWCFSLLLNEVFALYELYAAAAAGREALLPALPPPRPYRDYIAWLAGRDETAAMSYWRRLLDGFTAPTPVPYDRPGALDRAHGGRPQDYHEWTAVLPASLSRALEALAQRLRVTLNTVVQGAWALLLSCYAQESDVVFGAVVSGRPPELPGVESMVGLFINAVPVRARIPESEIPEAEPLSAWLPRLQESQLELRQHEWTPLAEIQKLVELPPGEPLFASLLVFENYPFNPSSSGGLRGLRVESAALAERTNYPLTLTVVARGSLSLRLTADRRFDPSAVRRLLAHLEILLEGFAAAPEAPPASRPLLTAAERHQIAVEWNDTVPAVSCAGATIPSLFAAQAARTPDAVAVVLGDEELTYSELAERAGRIAARLLSLGVKPETRIAVVGERSLDLIPTLLGILQAGCAYLPVDPELPEERRDFMLADAGAFMLPDLSDRSDLSYRSDLPAVSPSQLAYVIYTSGSTGVPKGVAVTHGNVARLVTGADYAPLGSGETLLQVVNVAFDVSTFEIWGPLVNGGRVVVFPGRPALDDLAAAIARHGVTTLWLTSGLFHQMVQERLEALRPLRRLLAGGDALSPVAVRRALEGLPGCTLINGYGPTENTTFTTCHAMTAAELADERLAATVPIGKPIRGTRVHVLDEALEPVPLGVWGELYAGGDGVARGYLARPALTAERFVPDPWGRGGRLYRTGDLVRWRPDGVLEFLGRRDGQVKVRGHRVELGEIETALAGHPAVREAVVVLREDRPGDRRLAAYVTAVSGAAADPAELRSHLAARLPEPFVPAAFMILDRLPLTPNGKVDRRALPPPEDVAAEPYVPPATPVEEWLTALCAELLGRERVGVKDNFFTLGGHSLLAIRLVARLREEHELDVPLPLVFDAADLRDLADRIVDRELALADGTLPAASPYPIVPVVLPASPHEYEPPTTPVEEALAAACAQVLELERVGLRDNFFALGGHSLLATQFAARLRDRHGLDVPIQLVFDAADLRDLADRIVDRELAAAGDALLVAASDPDVPAVPAVLASPHEYEPPMTPVEESLAAACADVLELERVGLRDNFFALGGHSLLAVQFAARLRERYGLDVPLQLVLDAADLRDLADRIVERELAAAGSLLAEVVGEEGE